MNSSSFIHEETKELIARLSGYLEQKISHSEIQAYIDRIFDKWEKENIEERSPYTPGEKEFWCSVWSTQHLASEDHWTDGVSQNELGLLLKVLKRESSLPQGYEGRRP
jgi:hypothetical protein